MDGIFYKSRTNLVTNVLGITAGALLVLLFLFLLFVDPEVTENTNGLIASIFIICFSIIFIVFCAFSLMYDRGAYLHMTEDNFSAICNWNKKIVCNYDEIAFADCGYLTLFIRLKNGKRYTVYKLLNAADICDALRKKLQTNMTTTMDKDTLRSEIVSMTSKRKKNIIWVISLTVLMFLAIFICIFFTHGRDFSDFTRRDWTIFIIFSTIELFSVIAVFYIANKVGKELPPINERKFQLRKLILETSPALPGNPLSIYMDSDYQTRITVFGFPNTEEVYFCAEVVDNRFDLHHTCRSPVCESIEDLKPLLDELIKIESEPKVM